MVRQGGYDNALRHNRQRRSPNDPLRPRLRPACPGRPGLGRRHVLRLDDSSSGGRRRAGGPSPPGPVAGGVPPFLPLGLGGGDPAADQRRRHAAPELQRFRRRAALRTGNDGTLRRHAGTVPAGAGAASAGTAPRGAGPGLAGGRAGAGEDPPHRDAPAAVLPASPQKRTTSRLPSLPLVPFAPSSPLRPARPASTE